MKSLPYITVCLLLIVFQSRVQAASASLSTTSSNRLAAAAARLLRQGVSSNGVQVVSSAQFQARIAAKAALAQSASPLGRGLTPLDDTPACISRSDMVAWWRGESDTADFLAAHPGTYCGTAAYTDGVAGSAFNFEDAIRYVDVPDNDGTLTPAPGISVEAWILPVEQYTPWAPIIKKAGEGTSSENGYSLEFSGSDVVFWVYLGEDWGWTPSPAIQAPFAEWSHVVGVYDGAYVSLYLNGELVGDPTEAPGQIVPSGNHLQIGHDPSSPDRYFNGAIDEATIYKRALSAMEVLDLFNAGSAGKCVAPLLLVQPQSQRVPVGWSTALGVVAAGTPPFSYQWLFGGEPRAGATDATLTLANAQIADSGTYSVLVSAPYGSTLSENAVVTVYTPVCAPGSSGLVSWWTGQGSGADFLGLNHGTLVSGPGFLSGAVGEAFVLDGETQYVDVANHASLNPTTTITVEAWIYPLQPLFPGSPPVIKKAGGGGTWGQENGYSLELVGNDGIRFWVFLDGAQGWKASPCAPLTLNRWSHVAGVYNGSTISFYLDGALVGTPVSAPGHIVPSTHNLQIGHDPSNEERYFNGLIDDASLYNTALSATEIQAIYEAGVAGKCGWDPVIVTQPTSQSAASGGTATFSVVASGTTPLEYQWYHDGSALPGATSSSIALNNVSLVDGGSYKAVVSSVGGSVQSVAATLTVSQVAAPAFAPVGGSYPSTRAVVVTCATAGATIRYTTDGAEPTDASPSVASGSTVTVDDNLTLKAKAWKTSWTTSATESESYRIEATPSGQPPVLTVSPPTGTTLLASDDLPVLVEASDPDGTIARIQLFRDGVQVAETGTSPLQYTMSLVSAGTYTFVAKAIDNAGFVTLSSPTVITVDQSTPVVALAGQQPYFTASPSTLVASVSGVNPGELAHLVLNGAVIPAMTGEFSLSPALKEGANTFTLVATDKQGRTGQATATVHLDSIAPAIVISQPANNSAFATARINVRGSFTESSIKRVTVNGVLAFVMGTSWEALNVPLAVGANTITATAEDIAGNTGSASINVTGNASPVDPVQLSATPVGGFAPLQVTFEVQSSAPGTLLQVLYDFDGNGVSDQTATDLAPVTHPYPVGQYFPVVTLVTTAGRFSSPGGWSSGDPSRLRINVQTQPQQVGSAISVTDPVDLRCVGGNLYVLSRQGSTVTEFNQSGAVLRSMNDLGGGGSRPTGLDVDAAGKVYVALNNTHRVVKLLPSGSTFVVDTSFGTSGYVGSQTPGSGNGQFNLPFDVAVSPDGTQIAVSDSGNHRVQLFGASDGHFISSFGQQGSGLGQFNTPKGVTYDKGGYLYIIDSGNSRICLVLPPAVVGTSGDSGAALGQFQGAINLSVSDRGIYVADAGNDRVQQFDPRPAGDTGPQTPFTPRGSLSSEFSPALNQPNSVAAMADLLEEKVYIADTENDRVILVRLPGDDPLVVWSAMLSRITAGDIPGALPSFSRLTTDGYRDAFLTVGINDSISDMGQVGTLTPVFMKNDAAQYYFEKTIQGHLLLFPVNFVRENGVWKIMEF